VLDNCRVNAGSTRPFQPYGARTSKIFGTALRGRKSRSEKHPPLVVSARTDHSKRSKPSRSIRMFASQLTLFTELGQTSILRSDLGTEGQ
jgi:hypothetical protein